ncbi:amidohydrolase family protein [Mesorhizobium sp. NBSH29]|uniref:amidohydrolase family protein n=1 Tax=Mesorhizobium sp. NBSH29 TaxID=2654249 RepID=UPI0018968098|nr:amidohydrolase family protein [Mesorhizobium sp. NBSH29]QPC85477.1 amidohydrolase family protein [Mesorhizobium sp. NBSH29]
MVDVASTAPTIIRNARHAIIWDEAQSRHCFAENLDIAFDESGILFIGAFYEGPIGAEIAGDNLMVMPGLVNIHCHSSDEPLAKGLFEDVGTKALWGNGLYEYSTLIDSDADAKAACQMVMIGDLLRSGVTSFLDIAGGHDTWIETARNSGARVWLAPGFRQARWHVENSHRLDYIWDEEAGRTKYAEALRFLDQILQEPSGRLSGVMAPSQIETCREALIVEAAAEARRRGIPITIHSAQTMSEHEELLRRSGETAPQLLSRLGVLGSDLILGHCIFLDHHPWTRQRSSNDLALLARSGTSVAHCPVTFARSGQALSTLGGYLRAGLNVGIGTDTYPFNMLEEMRAAIIVSRLGSGDVHDIDTGQVFHAATVGGAAALGRTDIGRLCVGARADLVCVDTTHPAMQPLHDPLRNLLYCAAERAVRDVYVDGRQVLRDGVPTLFDYNAAVGMLDSAQTRAIRAAEQMMADKRGLGALAPLSLPHMSKPDDTSVV